MDIPLYDAPELYDLIHGDFAAGSLLDFYLAQTREQTAVLELACGAGRLTIPLAEAGRRMVGLDLSEQMLALAKTKAEQRQARVSWVQGDMTRFSFETPFDTILLPAQALCHLYHREQIEGLFDCVRRNLKPDGTFVFEVFSPSVAILAGADTPETKEAEVLDHRGRRLRVTGNARWDAASQCTDCDFVLTDLDSADVTRLVFRMRQFFAQELDALVRYNGFEILQKYGKRDLTPFDRTSPQQLIVCRPGR